MNNRDYRREQARGTRPGGINCPCCSDHLTVKLNVRRERHKSKSHLSSMYGRAGEMKTPASYGTAEYEGLVLINVPGEDLFGEFLDQEQAAEDDLLEATMKGTWR